MAAYTPSSFVSPVATEVPSTLSTVGALEGVVDGTAFTAFFGFKFPVLAATSTFNGALFYTAATAGNSALYLGFTRFGASDRLRLSVGVANAARDKVFFVFSGDALPDLADGLAHSVLVSLDCNHGAGAKVYSVYVDDVALAAPIVDDTSIAFNANFAGPYSVLGGVGFTTPPNGRLTWQLPSFWLQDNLYTDFSTVGNRRKFIDAGNVAASIGAYGETPFGSRPTVFFTGSDSIAFTSNVGTGGEFLLDAGSAFAAPADITSYLNLVTHEHRDQPNFIASLSAIIQPLADLSQVLIGVPPAYSLDQAVGVQLDTTALWLGRIRTITVSGAAFELPDDNIGVGYYPGFRQMLEGVALLNRWDGTIPGGYTAYAAAWYANDFRVGIIDNEDMTMNLALYWQVPDATAKALFTSDYLKPRPSAVGVKSYYFATLPHAPFFGFDYETSFISGFDVGAWAEIIPGP